MHVAESCAQIWTCLRIRLGQVWELKVRTPHLRRIWEHRVSLWARGLARNVWDHCELTGNYGLASDEHWNPCMTVNLRAPGPSRSCGAVCPKNS